VRERGGNYLPALGLRLKDGLQVVFLGNVDGVFHGGSAFTLHGGQRFVFLDFFLAFGGRSAYDPTRLWNVTTVHY
jgi:hypothetical protein